MKIAKKLWITVLLLGLLVPAVPTSAAPEKPLNMVITSDGKKVQIKHMETKRTIPNDALSKIANQASKAIKEEKAKDHQVKKAQEGTYNFISGEGNFIYIYEETPEGDPVLVVADNDTDNNSNLPEISRDSSAKKPQVQIADTGTNFITDGIGGKQRITLTNSTYMSALMKLPISADEGSWNYGGFDYNSGTAHYSGEMGLQYYSNLGPLGNKKGWKPVLTFVKKYGSTRLVYNVGFDNNYKQVQYRNGYAMGASINYYTYYNYNGYVRMKMTGTAICADLSCSNETPTTLTTIMQTSQTVNLTAIDNYKLVTSIVTHGTSGNNKGIFSSIKVGTTSVPSSYFASPLVDHATITRDNNNTVTIECD